MKLLVISGGNHPYEESTPVLNNFLKGAGHDVTVTEDASVLADAESMSGYDALIFNTLRAGDNGLSKDGRVDSGTSISRKSATRRISPSRLFSRSLKWTKRMLGRWRKDHQGMVPLGERGLPLLV